jgi:hypothetical protein
MWIAWTISVAYISSYSLVHWVFNSSPKAFEVAVYVRLSLKEVLLRMVLLEICEVEIGETEIGKDPAKIRISNH